MNYFRKSLHLRYLTGFWIRFCCESFFIRYQLFPHRFWITFIHMHYYHMLVSLFVILQVALSRKFKRRFVSLFCISDFLGLRTNFLLIIFSSICFVCVSVSMLISFSSPFYDNNYARGLQISGLIPSFRNLE